MINVNVRAGLAIHQNLIALSPEYGVSLVAVVRDQCLGNIISIRRIRQFGAYHHCPGFVFLLFRNLYFSFNFLGASRGRKDDCRSSHEIKYSFHFQFHLGLILPFEE